jgi:hypothetical protein
VKKGWLVLIAVALTGCAPIEYGCDDVPSPKTWPLRQPTPPGVRERRATVSVKSELTGGDDEFWHKGFDPFRKVATSGLFLDVYVPNDPRTKTAQPDLLLAITAGHVKHDNFFEIIGLLTLGALPFWSTIDLSCDATLYDSKSGEKLGEWSATDKTRQVWWMPFLIPYCIATVGKLGGPFDTDHWTAIERASFERALANVLVQIGESGVLEKRASK